MSKQLPFSTGEAKPSRRFSARNLAWAVVSAGLLATGYKFSHSRSLWFHSPSLHGCGGAWNDAGNPDRLRNFQDCAINNLLETGLPFMNVEPIAVSDFEERRDRLAQALVAEGVDAFVVEPGYTFKYYGNVSQPEWEVWEVRILFELSEPLN